MPGLLQGLQPAAVAKMVLAPSNRTDEIEWRLEPWLGPPSSTSDHHGRDLGH